MFAAEIEACGGAGTHTRVYVIAVARCPPALGHARRLGRGVPGDVAARGAGGVAAHAVVVVAAVPVLARRSIRHEAVARRCAFLPCARRIAMRDGGWGLGVKA